MKKTLTLLLLASTTIAFGQKKKLELNLQKDSIYKIDITGKVDVDQLIQGNHQMVKTTVAANISCKVRSITDTLYRMDVTYNSNALKMELAGRELKFDSKGDTSNLFNKALNLITGKVFNLTLSKRGRIVKVENTDNLFNGIVNAFGKLPEQQRTQILNQMKQSFGEKTIKGNFQESFVIFSTAPVGVGSTWNNVNTMESAGFAINTKNTYTVKGETNNTYEISGTGVIVPSAGAEFKTINQFFMRLVGANGTTTADIKVDKQTGWIVQSHLIKHVKATVELKQSKDGPVALTYPMTIDGDITAINQ